MNALAISYIQSLTADPYPYPDYQVCRSPMALEAYLNAPGALEYSPGYLLISEDTESTPDGLPYCFTFSNRPGTGRLIYAGDTPMVEAYREHMWAENYHHVFHNWLHDDPQFELLDLPSEPFTDTMVRAYNLCLGGGADDENESRAGRGALGLKILAYRHCHIQMTSFRETVYPHSIPKMLDWLASVEAMFSPVEPESTCEHCGHLTDAHALSESGKTRGKCLLCLCRRHKKATPKKTDLDKKHGLLHRKTKNLIKALVEKEAPSEWDPVEEDEEQDDYNLVDPWKRVRGWHPYDKRFLAEAGLGNYPKASIADVPERDLLTYACKDADATLRLFLFLKTHIPWVFY